MAVLDKLGRGLVEDTRSRDANSAAAVVFPEASGRSANPAHCLLAHAKAVARAERSCSAARRSCGVGMHDFPAPSQTISRLSNSCADPSFASTSVQSDALLGGRRWC